jgi:biopolymer transport protein ExbB
LEPNLLPFEDPGLSAEVRRIVETGKGTLPFDPTLGNARKIEETEEGLTEHILKGGPVMAPILLLALAALVVAVCKWVQVARVRTPSRREVEGLIEALERRDYAGASSRVEALRGPVGEMLRAGLEHLHEPKELVEEVMFERLLETRLRLQQWLSFVAMSASAAPLLGLLGTVTGMITTFKLITVFGSGDARTLSSGISEALITTEYGLIVAIPSLLLYAWLSRRVRGLVDGMEKIAVSFLNRISTAEAAQHRLQAMAGVR